MHNYQFKSRGQWSAPPKNDEFTLKKQVFALIIIFVIVGLLGPFLAQVILPAFFPDLNIQGIETWNSFISIILGIVATILSIVSLYQSFINNSQTADMRYRIIESLQLNQTMSDNLRWMAENIDLNVKWQKVRSGNGWRNESDDC